VITPLPGLPYEPRCPIEFMSGSHPEKEVILLDATVLKIAGMGHITER
jgi:hypothetical protein